MTGMQGPRVMLVHSPLTGPSFFGGVGDALWQRGRRAYLARLPAAEHIHPPYWLTHAAGVANALPEEGNVVLVGHSGAGPLLPAIGKLAGNRGCEARVSGYLFMDCDLPRDGASRLDLFDQPDAAAALRARAERGWLRPWRDVDLAELLTDAAVRAAFVTEQPRTPLALYEEPIRVPDDWPEAPCGYLQLSAGYPTRGRETPRWGNPRRAADSRRAPRASRPAHGWAPRRVPGEYAAARSRSQRAPPHR